MTTLAKPAMRPARPEFSSGPCAKRPGWNAGKSAGGARRPLAPLQARQGPPAGGDRPDPRGAAGPGRLPDRHRARPPTPARWRWRCGRCSGQRPVQVLAFESFGKDWVTDVVKQLKLKDAEVLDAPATASCRTSSKVRPDADLVFTWNGTTSGVRVPNADFIAADRDRRDHLRRHLRRLRPGAGLAQARCGDLLLAEGAGRRSGARHADPIARARWRGWKATRPPWPLPKIFRLTKGGKVTLEIFEGADHQHPLHAVRRGLSGRPEVGFLDRRPGRAAARAPTPTSRCSSELGRQDALGRVSWPKTPATRSNTSVCLKVVDPRVAGLSADAQAEFAKRLAALLEKEGVALDVGGYRDAPPGLRIWCGATVETADLRRADALARLGLRHPRLRAARRLNSPRASEVRIPTP